VQASATYVAGIVTSPYLLRTVCSVQCDRFCCRNIPGIEQHDGEFGRVPRANCSRASSALRAPRAAPRATSINLRDVTAQAEFGEACGADRDHIVEPLVYCSVWREFGTGVEVSSVPSGSASPRAGYESARYARGLSGLRPCTLALTTPQVSHPNLSPRFSAMGLCPCSTPRGCRCRCVTAA
jgi:hypothetical protein